MIHSSTLAILTSLIDDLSLTLPDSERYRRLLAAARTLLPCDAAALLRLDGDFLVPLAVDGLSSDTLGRRFRVGEHPRLQALLASAGPMRFAPDSELPDPYDGLIDNLHGKLEVHDCMGCPVLVGGQPWGLLTLDALNPERFSSLDLADLQAFASLAAATVGVTQRIASLALRAEDERRRAEAYRLLAGDASAPALIGQSHAHQQLLNDIRVVGESELMVLVLGETGVGKELVAQALHAASARASRPLISLNCAALPETLVESELFGHVRGAFSGAVSDRRGKFELADGGTLFLDEVGELSLAVQAKLLRVLQGGQLQRLGSDREHKVDVRLIAATNRDLAQAVRSGHYRADFYHRISVFPLVVPPLRERGQDVLLLAGNFLEHNRSRLGLRSLRLDAGAKAAILAHDWPGNVRELEHAVARGALKALSGLATRPRIVSLTAAHLDLAAKRDAIEVAPSSPASEPGSAIARGQAAADAECPADLREATDQYQRACIEASLTQHHHNWSAAARSLGLHRANLVRLATRLGIAKQA
jgi:anaerobic nitric oxide reductase transcription regulator